MKRKWCLEDNSSHTTSAQSTIFLLSNELFYNTPSERCLRHGIPVDEPAKASRTYPDVSEWSWILREETHVWSSRWTVIEGVSNVCSLLFSWNCQKKRNGNCRCMWEGNYASRSGEELFNKSLTAYLDSDHLRGDRATGIYSVVCKKNPSRSNCFLSCAVRQTDKQTNKHTHNALLSHSPWERG